MLISDNLTCHSRPDFPEPAAAAPEKIRDSLVSTSGTQAICARLLQLIGTFPEPQPGAFLLTGLPGVGKTHVLRYFAYVLENPHDLPEVFPGERPRALRSIFISVPSDPGIDLFGFLATAIKGNRVECDLGAMPPEKFATFAAASARALAAAETGFVILDDISPRMDRIADEKKLQGERQAYTVLTEALARCGILPILVIDESANDPKVGTTSGGTFTRVLGEFPDVFRLSQDNIREILSSALFTKDSRQKETIRGILERLRRKLPFFNPDPERFVDLYPIHPEVFDAMFQLPLIVRGFSPLRFLKDAVPLILYRPEDRLLSLDSLFEGIQPELEKHNRFIPLLSSCEAFRISVLPRFKPGVQTRVESLLKAIAFSTICEDTATDVRSLAHSLLMYEDSDFLPSYSLTSTLLMEMEQKGGAHLVAEGEKLERAYRLLDLANPSSLSVKREWLERGEEFRRKIPLLIFDWIRSEIPIWRPEFSSKYERSSQSLVAPLPGAESTQPGLVYFKSEHDPFWSPDDFEVLKTSGYPWILLVLSPLERGYESDAALREFASHSERLLIWRPDRPSQKESERLHDLVTHHPALGPVSAFEASTEARDQARRILRLLYVERGLLVTCRGQWGIGEEIEKRRIADYFSLHLSALASLAPQIFAEDQCDAAPIAGVLRPDEKELQRIMAVLTGQPAPETPDSEAARNRILEWWNEVGETEAALFSQKMRALPDSFMTRHFWREVNPARIHFQTVQPILESLRRSETPLKTALEEVLHAFGGDDARMLEWRELMQNLAGLMRWVPGFEHSMNYTLEAFPLGQDDLDQRRNALISLISRPRRFIQREERERFDQEFLEFKRGYIDYYHTMHEKALNIVSASEEAERKIDARALQNLELLSNLLYTDKSYLNRVHILGKWILRNQCLLPVREILERYPRCYCNFNPAGNQELARSAGQINGLIEEGIEYFRNALRKCSLMIIEGLQSLQVDDFHSKQIAAMLSRGALVALKPKTIEILNKIIQKHSTDFLTALRS
jgi:hypothetical protein